MCQDIQNAMIETVRQYQKRSLEQFAMDLSSQLWAPLPHLPGPPAEPSPPRPYVPSELAKVLLSEIEQAASETDKLSAIDRVLDEVRDDAYESCY
jgi:hypothetical protein